MAVNDITQSQLVKSVRDFCLNFASPALKDIDHVIVGYTNNLTLPSDGNDFCVVTPISERRLHTTKETDSKDVDSVHLSEYLETVVQIDCYSTNRKDARTRVESYELVARSRYGVDHFKKYQVDCQHADICRNTTAILDSDQYVSRWTTTLTLGIWKQVEITQDYFTDIDPELINVDAQFKP